MTTGKSSGWVIPVIFLLSFITFYISAGPLMDDPDVPWHMAAGTLMLDTHHVPTADPWSFATAGTSWYLLSWVWDLILGITQRLSGEFGVLMLTLGLCAATVAGITWHLLRVGVALSAVLLTSMLAALCLQDFITARPQLISYILALIFHAFLYESRKSQRYGCLWALPPLMFLWANSHGSLMAGFIILGAYMTEAFFAKRYDWLRRMFVISALCAMAVLINPYGPWVIFAALLSFKGAATKYTIEWLPFAFSASTGVSAWLILFIMASNLRGRTATLADKILAIGWLIATMFIMRSGAIFIVLSSTYLACCLDEQTRDLRTERKPSLWVKFIEKQPLWRVWAATLALLAMFIAGAASLPHADKLQSSETSISDAIDYSLERYPDHRFLCDYNYGGQLIYRAGGKLPFFMDSRSVTAYSEETMRDYVEFLWQNPGWEQKMEKYRFDAMLLGNNTKFAKNYAGGQYHDHWKLVFAGKVASVYIARP